jgi:hypothetical protein
MTTIFQTNEYQYIASYYSNQKTKRSNVLLINHIQEGLLILEQLQANELTKCAYCLHPVCQSDTDLVQFMKTDLSIFNSSSLILAMEYRNIANQYLSYREIKNLAAINLSPLLEVNQMLIADKVQNRKDFDLYHAQSHPRSQELKIYFDNWFQKLAISEIQYQVFLKLISEKHE